ncbi:MAG: Uma2 family endonuclease [Candidatus Eremiobacterota bacterium]
MDSSVRKTQEVYSYKDYLTWPDEERWEIIDGIAYNMSPSPSDIHQDIFRELFLELGNYFRGKKCKVYGAPFDVILPLNQIDDDSKIYNIVQPDIIIVCDKNKISHKGCKGSPDIVIEIVSPSTASKDFIKKRRLYEKNKIKQYWIVSPEERTFLLFKLNENEHYGEPEEYRKEDKFEVESFEGLEIDLSKIFQEI